MGDDPGATNHTTGDSSLSSIYKPSNKFTTVTVADGSVLYLSQFPFNLMSMSQITKALNCCLFLSWLLSFSGSKDWGDYW